MTCGLNRGWVLILFLLVGVISYSIIASKTYVPQVVSPITNGRSRISLSAPLPPVAPMMWDDSEGAYMASLVVGEGVVELVLDTGSSQLSVKGPGCQWKTCNGNRCSVEACPCGFTESGKPRTDCTDHYYQPSGYKISPGEKGSGMNTTMTYGSQTDTIEHYVDTVHVSVTSSQVMCDDLKYVPRKQDMTNNTPISPGMEGVIVHRVLHIEGSSSSKIGRAHV